MRFPFAPAWLRAAALLAVPFAAFCFPLAASAQIFGVPDTTQRDGASIALRWKFTSVLGRSGTMTGARAAWIIDNRVTVGAGYYILASDVPVDFRDWESGDQPLLEFSYGGLELGFRQPLWDVISLSADFLVGGGGTGFTFPNDAIGTPRNLYADRSLNLWELQIGVEVRPVNWFSLCAGYGYRNVTDCDDVEGVTRANMRSDVWVLGLQFGK